MWLVKNNGVGKFVSVRLFESDGGMLPGEYKVAQDPRGKILDVDGTTLRQPTTQEVSNYLKQTPDELIAAVQAADDPMFQLLKALALVCAQQFNMTPVQMLNAIKTKL